MRIRALGVVTPAGAGLEKFLRALQGGDRLVKASGLSSGRFAAELPEPPKSFLRRKGLAPLSRAALLTAAALEDLFASPGAPPEAECGDCGLVVGTAYGHIESKAQFHAEARSEGVGLVSPIVFPNTIINSLAGHAAILFGLKGPNSTVTSGRRSGLEALVRARSLLLSGRARRVIVAGCDEVSPSLLRGLEAAGELARESPAGAAPSVPFDAGCSGIYPGEAAAAVVLESEDVQGPAGNGLAGLALLGQGEATAVGRTLVEASAQAMRAALERAGVASPDLAWAALSGSGSPKLDAAEAAAFREVCGEALPAAALKATFGETFGAAGLLDCAAAMACREQGFVPPTPGYVEDESELPPGSLSRAPRPLGRRAPVLLSAVDTGGALAVVVG
jgi:3-oxoacyl-[acyl-carrier-protein] synthase II